MYRGKLEGAGRVVLASDAAPANQRVATHESDAEPDALATPA